MNQNTILHLDSITKSFVKNIVNFRGQSEDERFYIIDDLDLEIPKGKITALVGNNGAGKTTLFNIISGFMQVDSGTITFKKCGKDINLLKKSPFEIAKLGIGRMFQDNHTFQNMSVLDNMLVSDTDDKQEYPFASLLFSKKVKTNENQKIKKVENIFTDLFGKNNPFWEMRNQRAKTLSYGQQRLLGLARLFMGSYELLLLDEPTAGVNSSINEKIVQLIRKLVNEKGVTILLIEHNIKVVLELAEFCCFISHGKIVAFSFPEEVIGNDEVRKTYMGI